MRSSSLQCLSVLTTCAMISVSSATTVNFDDANPGTVPPGWSEGVTGTGHVKWTIENESNAPSRPFVLKQSGWAPNPSFPLCVCSNAVAKDGFVQVRFKALAGTNDQAAGLVWRYRDPQNYYVVRANSLEDNVVLYRVERGQRKALDIIGRSGGYGVKTGVPARQWSTLRVEFTGPHFRVLLNGKALFTVEDSTFSTPGLLGLWTKADSVTLFDDFTYEAN